MAILAGLVQFNEAVDGVVLEVRPAPDRTDYLPLVSVLAGVAMLFACAGWGRADELTTSLEPHVGQTLDLVELGTGKRIVRPVLEGITTRDERATAIRLRAEGESKTMSVPVSGIARIIAGRETIHEADAKASSTALSRSRRAREVHERQQAESRERGCC